MIIIYGTSTQQTLPHEPSLRLVRCSNRIGCFKRIFFCLYYLLPVMMLKIKIVNNMNSSVTEMIEEPLMIPSQPPILAEN